MTGSELPNLLDYHDNDHGNAERLIALYGSDLRFCHALRKWLVWDGKRWAVDETEHARHLATKTMLGFLQQAADLAVDEDNKRRRFAYGSLNARPITNLLRMAQSEIFVRPTDLDTDPYLLNFVNGTVDLRTGVMHPHRREDLITRLVRYNYRPGSRCPRFLTFLTDIVANDGQMLRYLQRAVGYSLTGCTGEKAVFVLFGEGNNGKTTLLATIRKLIEDYAVLLCVDTLMVRQESNNTQADLADLRGARFVQTSETESGQRLAQGKLKRITQGMGTVKAVRKYENPIEFPETHKLWMDTNRKPTITDADDQATFNRLHPIPFSVRIENIDRDLPGKLLQEAEGILSWAVAGAKIWHTEGLGKPPAVEAANEAWRAESHSLDRFVRDRCLPDGEISGEKFYQAYQTWAKNRQEKDVLSAQAFGMKMSDWPGVTKSRTKDGIIYVGLKLRGHRASLLPPKVKV